MVGQLKKVLFEQKINVQRLDQATVDERGELSDTWSNQFTNLACKIVEQGETENRDLLLEDFENQDVDILYAIKCLDEGVNVPSTQNAI